MPSILPKVLSAFTCKSHRKRYPNKMNKFNYQATTAIGTIVLTFSLFSGSSVNAASFIFSQEGWRDGGELLGSFIGNDLNNDGKIETFELSSFNATFSGNLRGNINNPFTGEPIIISSTISHSLAPLANVVETLDFEYSFSTSQLSFSSLRTTCGLLTPLECVRLADSSTISTSDTGGTIISDPSARFGLIFSTSSLSAPVVIPVEQSIPEPSTLGATLLGELALLLRKKVMSPRHTTKTTSVKS